MIGSFSSKSLSSFNIFLLGVSPKNKAQKIRTLPNDNDRRVKKIIL